MSSIGIGVPVQEVEATTSASVSVRDAVMSRHSCRAFAQRTVESGLIHDLLDTARFAPSGGNLQPWLVHVLSGESMLRFRTQLTPKFQAEPLGGAAEYHVYPPNLKEPYRSRRQKSGEDMYGHIGVPREDKAARHGQFARNFDFFGAPAALFFFVDRCMGPPQWSDVGMFMQNIMLLARERGLETCAQESWAIRHKEVGEFLGIESTMMLFCGLAIGYGDYAAPINRLRTERTAVVDFTVFHD
jgi:nitroreductase